MEKTDGDLKSFLLALLEVILKEKRKLFNFSISFLTIMKNDNLNSENFDEDKAREIGQAKHEQAKKLIFMILERKIEYWWD